MPLPEYFSDEPVAWLPDLPHAQLVERYGSHYTDSFAAIPAGVFTPGFKETICTPSGHNVVCEVSEDIINICVSESDDEEYIQNYGEPRFRFWAGLTYSEKYADRVLSFYLRNRDPESATPEFRHPDIHPSCLARRSLDYFREQGNRVEKMATDWVELAAQGDNWRQYHAYLAAHKEWWRGPRPEDRYRAVFATMSGQLAARLGFSELRRHEASSKDQSITSLFVKPDGITAGRLALMCASPDLLSKIPGATNRRGNL